MAEIEEQNKETYEANPNQKVYDTPHVVDHLVDVVEIYFAEKKKKFKWVSKEETYTVNKGGKITDVKKKYTDKFKTEKKTVQNLTTDPDHTNALNPKDQIKVSWEEQEEDGFELIKIPKVIVGKKIFIVVRCTGDNAKLTVQINENKLANTEAVYDGQVKFLIGEEEKDKVEFYITKDKNEYSQEITLRPKSDEDFKKLVEKYQKRTDKNAFLYLKGEVTETSDEIKFPDETHEFLNKDKERLEVSGTLCYCDRDITVEEFKQIIKEMRVSEKITSTTIFTESNCTLPDAEKTYEKLTEEYNKTCKKHKINTCIRKIHFFAQTYWEADRFRTTLEYSSGEYLNPDKHDDARSNGNTDEGDGPRYKGRGLMQLTWRGTYKSYFDEVSTANPELVENKTTSELLDRKETFEEKYYYFETDAKTKKKVKKSTTYKVDGASFVGSKIELAVDSAGWFWNSYKKVSYSKASTRKLYQEILNKNLNEVADFGDKYTDVISKFVNGGGNGLSNRKTYYEKLRDNVFKIKEECINYDKIKK